MGGACISQQQAEQLMASYAPFLQDLQIELSSDGHLDAFEVGLQAMAAQSSGIVASRPAPCEVQNLQVPSWQTCRLCYSAVTSL